MRNASVDKRRGLLIAGLGLAALAGCTHTDTPRLEREQARLARMIEGRVAGEPRSCITVFDMGRLQIVDRTAVVYESGDTVWVSRPTNPTSLDTRDIVVIRRSGSQLCKHDVIRMVDRTGHFTTGVVFLEDFVPYRRP